MVVIQPGKERKFADEIMSEGLILDSEVERIDFVHGDFDFIVSFAGSRDDIDRRILEIRKIPYVQSTETLIPFEMFSWDDISVVLRKTSTGLVAPKTEAHGLPSSELEVLTNCKSPIVLYSTKLGSTRRIATEIAAELNCPLLEVTANSDPSAINLDEFDLLLIGTGIYQRQPNQYVANFLKSATLDGDKQFALFLTWYRIADNDKGVYRKIDEILEAKGKNLLDGYFECIGDRSRDHPNSEDLNAARKWVSKIIKKP
jgi:flavodoxin